MRDLTASNFGLLIAYVIPGFVSLWGVSEYSETVRSWLTGTGSDLPSVGGFLYVTIASVGAGLTVSTVRWLVIDWIHHRTGIEPPSWDFSRLPDAVSAFKVLNEIHYRYYQWYANSIVALLTVLVLRTVAHGWNTGEALLVLAATALFFAGSRDTLRRYYRNVEGSLGRDPSVSTGDEGT